MFDHRRPAINTLRPPPPDPAHPEDAKGVAGGRGNVGRWPPSGGSGAEGVRGWGCAGPARGVGQGGGEGEGVQ